MIIVDKMTANEIKIKAFNILKQELGITGFIRFIQQFDLGMGNYVIDRNEWQKDYDVKTITQEIKKKKKRIIL